MPPALRWLRGVTASPPLERRRIPDDKKVRNDFLDESEESSLPFAKAPPLTRLPKLRTLVGVPLPFRACPLPVTFPPLAVLLLRALEGEGSSELVADLARMEMGVGSQEGLLAGSAGAFTR